MNNATGICICGSPLVLTQAKACYEETNKIECDECSTTVKGNENVYHCQNKNTAKHDEGFDLCTKCVLQPTAQCICGCKLLLSEAQKCYYGFNQIECDKCEKTIKGSKKVYHCPNTKTNKHKYGYDLCKQCALTLQKLSSKSKKTTSITMDRNEYLVCGFIRWIQFMLKDKHKIIPTVIYEMCYQFFIPTIIPCFYIHDSQNNSSIVQFGLLDIDNRKCTMLVTKHVNTKKQCIPNYRAQSFCKIANIEKSNGIITCVYNTSQNKNNRSDGSTALKYDAYPYLFVYGLSFIDNKINVKYEMKSQQSIPCLPKTWLSCGNNSIVYEYNGKLFKHDFNEKFANFKPIQQNEQQFKLNNTTRRAQWLNMTYLSDNNFIFCVQNHGNTFFVLKKKTASPIIKYEIECGIFNMNNNKWIKVKPLKGKTSWNKIRFESICCYENNSIFIANNLNHTARFDMNQQIWTNKYILKDDAEFYGSRKSVLWLENDNLLNLLTNHDIQRHKQGKLVWSCIDLRENPKSLIQRSESIEGMFNLGITDAVFVSSLFQ